MKAISLWQPWASFIAAGIKQFETRSWATKHRGPLLIHAAHYIPRETIRLRAREDSYFAKSLADLGLLDDLPRGAAIAIVDLVSCHRAESLDPDIIAGDFSFGDFSPGRFAWELKLLQVFKPPPAMRGRQGLFECEVFQEHP